MSNSSVSFVINKIIDAYRKNKKLIDTFPVEESDHLILLRRNPGEYSDKMLEVGKEVAADIYDTLKDKVEIDFNGHEELNRVPLSHYANSHSAFSRERFIRTSAYRFARAVTNLPSTNQNDFNVEAYLAISGVIEIFLVKFGPSDYSCTNCGEELRFGLDMDTLTIRLEGEYKIDADKKIIELPTVPCIYPNGIGPHDIELSASSGKLVVANDLRRVLSEDALDGDSNYISEHSNGKVHGINSALGRKLNSEYWAQHGLMYFQVGNTSPSYFRNTNKTAITFKDEYVFDNEGEDVLNYDNDEELMGYVCTDLWAVNAMDYDRFIEWCNTTNQNPEEFIEDADAKIIDVNPGTYICTGYYEDSDREVHHIYATMKLKEEK